MINRYTFAGLGAVLAVCLVGVVIFLLANPPASTPAATTPPGTQSAAAAAPTAAATGGAKGTATPAAAGGAKPKNLQQAAQAAGCVLKNPPDEGAEHVPRDTVPADYGSNPPTSGIHTPEWASDGIYGPNDTPTLGNLVHTLEHGRIDVQYKPGTPPATINALTKWVKSADGGYHMLLFQNTTQMPYAVAATAWDHLIGCPQYNPNVITALKFFREAYIDQGPEVVP